VTTLPNIVSIGTWGNFIDTDIPEPSSDDSIQYQIATSLVNACKLIKSANGYNYNVVDSNISIAKAITQLSGKPGILIDILDTNPNDEYNLVTDEWYNYLIRFYNSHNDENPDMYVDNKNVIADIVKAIKVDETRGGLAIRTEKREAGPMLDLDTQEPYIWVAVACQTIVISNNPYSTGG